MKCFVLGTALFAILPILLPAQSGARVLKVGIMDCYSGPATTFTYDVRDAFKLAIDEVNAKGGEGWDMGRVYELFPALKDIESRKGGCLSGGEQKMLAIARALIGNPELLLLDEPTEGLAPTMVHALEDQIRKLKKVGLTVLLAEQNVRSALRLIDHGYIIDNGQIRYQGSVGELRENEEVKRKYLVV